MTVNHWVGGSSPSRGATYNWELMSQRNKISLLELLFNVLFFLVCIIFLFTIFFIFSPFSDTRYFPVLSQYIERYFWAIYSGPVVIAFLCFIKKKMFFDKRDRIKYQVNLQSQQVKQMPEPVEIYKHDA